MLRCDNGPELACAAMTDWAGERLGLSSIPPGQPWRNGYVESFNSRVRDECLNINLFWSLTHAKIVISDWKTNYNQHRRHSALGYLAPARYAAICTPPMKPGRLSHTLAQFMGSCHGETGKQTLNCGGRIDSIGATTAFFPAPAVTRTFVS